MEIFKAEERNTAADATPLLKSENEGLEETYEEMSEVLDPQNAENTSGTPREVLDENEREIRNEVKRDPNPNSSGASAAGTSLPPSVKSSNEDEFMEIWQKRKKHFLIISQAGKPIYSRYGDEFKLSSFSGILQAIISFVENQGDQIQSIQISNYQVVLLSRGSMYFCAISANGESVTILRNQLEFLYNQIMMILTSAVERSLMKNPKCDVKNLLGGTEASFASLSSCFSSRFDPLLHCFSCLRLPPHFRSIASKSLQSSSFPSLIFSILLCDSKVISLANRKDAVLHPDDLFLISNFVNSSKTFRSSESFTPICFPNYDASKFLFAYIDFVFPHTALILVSSDCNSFHHLKTIRTQIVSELTRTGSNQEIAKSLLHGDLKVHELPFTTRRITSLPKPSRNIPGSGQTIPLSNPSGSPFPPSSLPEETNPVSSFRDKRADSSNLEDSDLEEEGAGREEEGQDMDVEIAMGLFSQGEKAGIDLAMEAESIKGGVGVPREGSGRRRTELFSFSENEMASLTGGPSGLLHFCFTKPKTLKQFVCSDFSSPINSKRARKDVFRAYQKIISSMQQGNHKMQYRRDQNFVTLGWRTSEFEIYSIFDPLAQKRSAIAVCNSICQWILSMESELFISNTFS